MSRFGGSIESNKAFALALIICDRIIIEPDTREYSLIGTFDAVLTDSFPCNLHRLSIYAAIASNGENVEEIHLGVFDPSGTAIVQSTTRVIDWGGGVAEFAIPLSQLMLNSSGDYVVQIFVEDRVLLERKIAAKISPGPSQELPDQPIACHL